LAAVTLRLLRGADQRSISPLLLC